MEIFEAWCLEHPQMDPKDYFRAFGIRWKIENEGTEDFPVFEWTVWTEHPIGTEKKVKRLFTVHTTDEIELAEVECLGELKAVYTSRKRRDVLHILKID